MSAALLEVVEGPDAGRQMPFDRQVTIGRDESADFVLSDPHASRRHCQVVLTDGRAIVKDLSSANGTFVNNQEVIEQAELGPGDDLLVGVSVLELRGKDPDATRPLSGVRAVPDGLRAPQRTPDYVPEPIRAAEPEVDEPAVPDTTEKLNRYLDMKVKGRTRLAPLILALLAGAFVLVFQLTEGLGSVPDLKIIWS
jgi:pSer/pThr/pTyr-binding forkhead associated (FHA) protein